RARFDEQVVVKLVEIFLENPNLFGDEIKQLPERFALFRVADAMDRRQQIVEFVRIVAHNITSRSIGAVSRVSSSAAPNEFGSPPLGRFASRRELTIAGEPVRCSAVTFTATTPATACSSAITSLNPTGWPKLRAAKENALRSASFAAASTLSVS